MPEERTLNNPRLRRIILLSISTILSILIVLFVIVWAAFIWAHSSHSPSTAADPLTTIGDVFTLGTLLLGLTAGLVALRVYAITTGQPDLKFRIRFFDQDSNQAHFKKAGNKLRQKEGENFAAGNPWEKDAYIWVKNDSKYPARNPTVIISLGYEYDTRPDAKLKKLKGMAIFRPRRKPNRIMDIFKPAVNQDWRDVEFRSSGEDVLVMQWDGGTEYPIHANSTRRLPDLSFDGLYRDDTGEHVALSIQLIAEGYIRRPEVWIPVAFLSKTESYKEIAKGEWV